MTKDPHLFELPEIPDFPQLPDQPRAETLFGMFQTVSAAPTKPPKTFLDQIQIYTSGATLRLYWWDNTNITWHYVTATA